MNFVRRATGCAGTEGTEVASAPAFQLYRFAGEDEVWWRLVSPNGRGLARSAAGSSSVDAARGGLDELVRRVDDLEQGIRLTDGYRWRWSLRLGDTEVAVGLGDQDRRVRCLNACRTFVALAPHADVDPVLARFRRAGTTITPDRAAR